MRSIRSVALSCVLVVAALFGNPAAASAAPAPFAMEWNVSGVSAGGYGALWVCPTVGGWDPAQTLQLQVLQNGTWLTKRTYAAGQLQGWDCAYPAVSDLIARAGAYQLRAVTPATASTLAAEARTTLTVAAQPGFVEVASTAYTTTTASKAVRATVLAAHGQHVILQRKSGTAWVTVSSANAPTTGYSADVRLPVSNLAGLSWYRVVMGSTPFETAYFSSQFPIHQTDVVRYASYISLAHKYIAPFCPQTPIFINTPIVMRAGVALMSATWSGSPGERNTLTTHIELPSGGSGTMLRSVVLHECGHVIQARSRVENRYATEEANAKRLYPGTGFEGQADCMAYYYVRAAQDLTYVRSCSAAQLTDALRMWRAYGYKYLSPNYSWIAQP